MYHLVLHLFELPPGCQKDFQVDAKHEEEGHQHTGKEVVVDHVLHGDHCLEETSYHAFTAVAGQGVIGVLRFPLGAFVPAQHGRQADDEGQDPADGNDTFGSRAGHQTIVPGKQRRGGLNSVTGTST